MAQEPAVNEGAIIEPGATPGAENAAADHILTETGASSEAHSSGFPPFNAETFSSQLVWLAIVFGVLYLLMSRVALPRVAAVIAERRGRISSDLEEAARAKQQTDAAIAAYEKALAEARARAHGIAQETRDRLTAETDRRRHETEAQLAGKIAQAEASIATTKAAALANVRLVAVDVAGTIVDRLLGEPADKTATENAVDAALKRS